MLPCTRIGSGLLDNTLDFQPPKKVINFIRKIWQLDNKDLASLLIYQLIGKGRRIYTIIRYFVLKVIHFLIL